MDCILQLDSGLVLECFDDGTHLIASRYDFIDSGISETSSGFVVSQEGEQYFTSVQIEATTRRKVYFNVFDKEDESSEEGSHEESESEEDASSEESVSDEETGDYGIPEMED